MHFLSSLLATTALATLAAAHGYFQQPLGRQPGSAYASACSQQAYYNMQGSINGNIQGLLSLVSNQGDYNPKECDLWLCKGMKFEDNKNNVQSYSAGQEVELYFQIVAPHTGYANVSVVHTSTNSVIGDSLIKWDVFASVAVPKVDSQERFKVTIPKDLEGKCGDAGECVIQMFWNAPSVNQTYESCIDFTVH